MCGAVCCNVNRLRRFTAHFHSTPSLRSQYVAACCNVLQCVAACCRVLYRQPFKTLHGALSFRTKFAIAVCCSMLQYVAVCCSVLQCVAVCCIADPLRRCTAHFHSVPSLRSQYVADALQVRCSVLQCVAVYCIVDRLRRCTAHFHSVPSLRLLCTRGRERE